MTRSQLYALHCSVWTAAVWNYEPILLTPYQTVGIALAILFGLRALAERYNERKVRVCDPRGAASLARCTNGRCLACHASVCGQGEAHAPYRPGKVPHAR